MIQIDTANLEETAFILKTIAHPMRLQIVCLLGSHESLTVSEICAKVDCEQSLVSHHLNLMKLKGVLESKRSGKNIHYILRMREVLTIISCVNNCQKS